MYYPSFAFRACQEDSAKGFGWVTWPPFISIRISSFIPVYFIDVLHLVCWLAKPHLPRWTLRSRAKAEQKCEMVGHGRIPMASDEKIPLAGDGKIPASSRTCSSFIEPWPRENSGLTGGCGDLPRRPFGSGEHGSASCCWVMGMCCAWDSKSRSYH